LVLIWLTEPEWSVVCTIHCAMQNQKRHDSV
jgi:hypothetical protein